MSIKPTLAITRLAIHTALHSRLLIWLFAGTLATTAGLPFMLRSDGTAAGHIRLAISYPFAISFIILALGTLWLSSGLISQEIAGKELQSVSVKPVHTFEIWLGKWLALLSINIFLVFTSACGLAISLSIITARYDRDAASVTAIRNQVLTARHAIPPQPIPDLLEYAELMRQRLIRQHVIPKTTGIERICGELKSERSMVSSGNNVSWNIPLTHEKIDQSKSISLRYTFRCDATERRPVSGTWTITDGGRRSGVGSRGSEVGGRRSGVGGRRSEAGDQKTNDQPTKRPTDQMTKITLNVRNISDGTHNLMLPAAFKPSGTNLTVKFTHIAPAESHPGTPASTSPAPTIYFDPDTPVELMLHQSSFAMNSLRAAIAVICFLACIAAVGLTMSSLFSFPVAAFTSLSILFAVALASGFSENPPEHNHGHQDYQSKAVQLTEPAIIFLKHATSNITTNIPVSSLAGGILFSWRQTAECILLLLLIIPILLGTLSSLILSGKELAL